MSTHARRIDALRELLADRELSALLVTGIVNVRYLTGFTGTAGVLLVDPATALLVTDFRYTEQAAVQAPHCEIADGERKPRELIAARMPRPGRVGFDDADMRVRAHEAWRKELPQDVDLVAAAGLVEQLREVKDPDEIDAIARAAKVADAVYERIAADGLTGRTETEVAWAIASQAHDSGASGLSFPPIVAAGAHGALPHAEPRDHAIERGEPVVLDLGVIVDGYCSDATRTFFTDDPTESQLAIYELVLAAQSAALETVAAGVPCRDVDAAARQTIDAAGHGERFGHSTGHGVGLEVHEGPTLAVVSTTELRAGNVVTVEPGVYLPGEFGVRIEDLVVVTATGAEILSTFTKEPTVVG